ncbi:MAG: hypothetical protein ACFFHD_12175 [Promethearchaeota archaeon]
MKGRIYIYVVFVLLIIFFNITSNALAVMIPRYEEKPLYIIFTILAAFLITVVAEFGSVYPFLKSSDLVKKDLFLSVTKVNLLVFTPGFTIFYFLLMFYIELLVIYNIFIGILMILIEWVFYRLEFQKLLFKRSMTKKISLRRIFMISTLANIISYSFIYLYPTIVMLQQYFLYPELFDFPLVLNIEFLH